jgi:DNA polymerase-4
LSRIILHVDMDAYFAAIEQRDNPSLMGRPVVVGGHPASRGVVATASYEARAFGVRSALPSRQALLLCPQAVFVRPDFAKYKSVSDQLMAIFRDCAKLVEPMSLDEAFLDCGAQRPDLVAGERIGREIMDRVRRELDLSCSVGVSFNKLLAKLASDLGKPGGLTVIDEERAATLLPGLPIRRLWGVGERTETTLRRLGVHTCADLCAMDPALLRPVFGRRLDEMLAMAQGVDHRPVAEPRASRSIGEETTFEQDLGDFAALVAVLGEQAAHLSARLAARALMARTITLKYRYPDFTSHTRSRTMADPTADGDAIREVALNLAEGAGLRERKVRLIGLSVSNFVGAGDSIQQRLVF